MTGSNSYMLSDEITTKLTGRYLSFEAFPLDFSEYLEMKRFYGIAIQDLETEFDFIVRNQKNNYAYIQVLIK